MQDFDLLIFISMSKNHILSTSGILSSFSIARVIPPSRMEEIIKSAEKEKKKRKLTDFQTQNLIKEQIFIETQEKLQTEKIPGMLTPETELEDAQENTMEKINSMSKEEIGEYLKERQKLNKLNIICSKIVSILLKTKMTKFYYCYMIHCIVGMLGLSDSDFESFNKSFYKDRPEEGDDDDNDEF